MNVAQWREPHDTELASAMGIRPERLREIRLAALYPSLRAPGVSEPLRHGAPSLVR
jgi:hypothetical protein